MDRAYVERLLANAKSRETTTVALPVCGQELHLFTALTQEEQLRVGTAGGVDEDAMARYLTGILRYLLVDGDGQLLLRSFAEASGLVNALDVRDLQVLMEKLFELASADAATGDVEAGKAS